MYDDRIRLTLIETIEKYGINKIVTHAEPHGVCEIARKLAQELGLILELHYLNLRNGRGMFSKRSLGVIENSDYTIVFHDGISKGTSNEIKLLKKLNKQYDYYKLDREDDLTTYSDFEMDEFDLE